MKIIIILLLFATTIFDVCAQNKIWTLKDCIAQAADKNVFLNQNKASNEINKINVKQNIASRFPTLNGSANQNYQFGRSVDPSTNNFVQQNYTTNNFGISSSVTLFNGFQQVNIVRQNRLLKDAGDKDIERVYNDLALSVTSAYLNILLAYELIDNARFQLETSKAQVERTERLVRAGSIAELALYEVRSQFANDQLTLITAQNQLSIAHLNLQQFMELPITDSFVVERLSVNIPEGYFEESQADTIYSVALTNQPQIKGFEIRKNSALTGLKVAKGAYAPRLSLSGSIFTFYSSIDYRNLQREVYPFQQQISDKVGEQISINLNIPIINNRIVKSNVEKAKVNATIAQLDEQNAKNILRKNIEQAVVDLKAARQRYIYSQEAMKFSEFSYQSSEKRFALGSINATDYLLQKNIFYSAKGTMSQAKYEYFFKLKVLDFYQGKGF